MPKQPAVPGLRDALKRRQTRREQFLAEMDVGGSVDAAAGADRAALPQGRAEGRSAADAAGDDASGLLSVARHRT